MTEQEAKWLTEEERKALLHDALIGELVLPLIPVAKQAIEEMLTGKNKAARDMKAAYLIAELGRDLLKGTELRDAQKRRAEIVGIVREFLAIREPASLDESKKEDFFAEIEAERSGGDASRDGTRIPAPPG